MSVIRGGLLFLFAFSVLAFGAVEVWSGSVLEIGASLLFIGWAALVFVNDGVRIHWNPLNWPLLGLFVIGLAQLLLHATPYPFLTRVELLKLAAYLLIFFLATQVFRERRDLTNPRLVPDSLVFLGVAAGHRAALHLRRENLWIADAQRGRRSLRPVREPQSFCRIRGTHSSGRSGAVDFPRIAPRS